MNKFVIAPGWPGKPSTAKHWGGNHRLWNPLLQLSLLRWPGSVHAPGDPHHLPRWGRVHNRVINMCIETISCCESLNWYLRTFYLNSPIRSSSTKPWWEIISWSSPMPWYHEVNMFMLSIQAGAYLLIEITGYCIGTIPEALLSLFDKAQLPELTVYPSARSELFPKYLTNLIYR